MDRSETKLPSPLPVKPRERYPCKTIGCMKRGVYFNGKQVGMRKVWGHWCQEHNRSLERENLDRSADEKMFGEKG